MFDCFVAHQSLESSVYVPWVELNTVRSQVPASGSDAEAALRAECQRGPKLSKWTPANVTTLVSAFAAVPSLSLDAADDFVSIIAHHVYDGDCVNRVTFGATAGAIEALVKTVSTHGPARSNIALRGCNALCNISSRNRAVTDRLVMSFGGLDAICSVMASHGGNEGVQRAACEALWKIADTVSDEGLNVMKDGPVLDLVHEAKRNFPPDDDDDKLTTVKYYANQVLDVLDSDYDDSEEEEEELPVCQCDRCRSARNGGN